MAVVALTLPGVQVGTWTIRNCSDPAALGLARHHYSRQHPDAPKIGAPGRHLVLVSPCQRALWDTHYTQHPDDGLDAWRCSIFRNEGAGLSSDLIRSAMDLTAERWGAAPPDGWVTWVDRRRVRSSNPGYCFLRAGWWKDRAYHHPHLVRLRCG